MKMNVLTLSEIASWDLCPAEQRISTLIQFAERVGKGARDTDVLAVMAQLAADEDDPDVRDAWLTYIGASREDVFIPVLERWLSLGNERERLSILHALVSSKSPKANDLLLRAIREDASASVRRRAVRHLVRRGSLGEWQPIDLLSIVREEDWMPVTRREFLRLIRLARPHDPGGHA